MSIHATDYPSPHDELAVTAPTAAEPVIMGPCAGFFMAAHGERQDQAVLFLSPWGFEEMSVRKFWRVLADRFADVGISSLRFDLPGTGNSQDLPEDAALTHWQEAIVEAAAGLRRRSGASRILVVAQGLGAALGATLWHRLGALSGVALLAPVVSGKLYMRELALWARITDGKPDPEKELRAGRGFWISGLRLPDGVCEDLRTLDVTALPPPECADLFIALRPDRPSEATLASTLAGSAKAVVTHEFEGYERLISNLNFSEQPAALIASLTDWASRLPAARTPGAAVVPSPGEPRLVGDGFVETPVRFGAGERLVGVVCEPLDGKRTGATVILLSTAYHPNAGWGRIGADGARALARQGIASLRFDYANASDSPPLPGAPEQILYSTAQDLDVAAAVDLVERKGLMPVVIGGRCSGGYLAFRSVLLDPRLKGAVCANPYAFYWDGRQSVEDLLRFVPKPLGNYGVMLLKGSTWKRMVRGEIDLKYAVINVSRGLTKRAVHGSETLLKMLPFLSREHREVHGAFQKLAARNAAISLLYADDDPGMANLLHHFGEGGRKLSAYRNVSLRFLENTDHNLSTPEAREVFTRELLRIASRFPPGTV